MNANIASVYNSILIYTCLILFSQYVFNHVPRKKVIACSYLCFIPFLATAVLYDTLGFAPFFLLFIILQFVFLKVSFYRLKLSYLIIIYTLLNCSTLLLSAILSAMAPNFYFYVDMFTHTLVALSIFVICCTKAKYLIQEALTLIPKYVLILSCILLLVASVASGIISMLKKSLFPVIWSDWIQVLISFLLMAIGVVVPIIFIISISNTRLKTLTADYEQQIHAQAEHYKKLAEANYEVRRFRHDFQNVRIAMATLLEQGDYEQAKLLIVQSGDAMDSMQPLFSTGNGIADALLTDKQARADAINTSITFSGVIPPDSLSPTDLCVLLGNSLDNALDACRKLPLRDRKVISVNSNCAGGFLFLTIRNPIGERVTIRNNHIATTKADKTLHGYGLYSLHTIVKRYDGQIQLNATDDSFTVSIDLSVPVKH